MYNLALMPVENYGFWHNVRSKELFKVISIASPYCWKYESSLFLADSATIIPDIYLYERLLEAIGDDINKHPYVLAESLPEAPWLGDQEVLIATVRLRVLWHRHLYRGILKQTGNRVDFQFQSGLNLTQESTLMTNIKILSQMVNR